ncbi:MAG TPA: phosphatase PAP2 family protein [Rhodanobacteraceae bacterium]|nr:phosphatase PAP2 family protein [Rhodanobacteraceae bacterium]
MNRRVLFWAGIVSSALTMAGVLLLDRPLAQWLRASGHENAAFFREGLAALDSVSGLAAGHIWWACCVFIAIGAAWLGIRRSALVPRVLVATGLIDAAAIEGMILLKGVFGRLRPAQVLESGDWSALWFVGGGSFPSGHSAFYFGLFLPLAAACPHRWARAVLLAVPVFVVLARIDLARHFLSDVAASAVMVALIAWIVATVLQRWLPTPAAHPGQAARDA